MVAKPEVITIRRPHHSVGNSRDTAFWQVTPKKSASQPEGPLALPAGHAPDARFAGLN
jgi:hypothetical protein